MDVKDVSQVQKWVAEDLKARYGTGPQSAWEHMSAEQRADARTASKVRLIFAQDTHADTWTLVELRRLF